jgi:hypothetical protein
VGRVDEGPRGYPVIRLIHASGGIEIAIKLTITIAMLFDIGSIDGGGEAGDVRLEMARDAGVEPLEGAAHEVLAARLPEDIHAQVTR